MGNNTLMMTICAIYSVKKNKSENLKTSGCIFSVLYRVMKATRFLPFRFETKLYHTA